MYVEIWYILCENCINHCKYTIYMLDNNFYIWKIIKICLLRLSSSIARLLGLF